VLAPDKEVLEVVLTPAHQRSPWRELVGGLARELTRDAPVRDEPAQREPPGLER
jgi:hypothetical protein